MKEASNRIDVLFAIVLLVVLAACENKATNVVKPAATAESSSAEDLARRTIERRAVEAVIWGMPAVNYDLIY
ncbi:MAG TPA: hypothetical protein VI455_18490 [Terriglobia bacterium]